MTNNSHAERLADYLERGDASGMWYPARDAATEMRRLSLHEERHQQELAAYELTVENLRALLAAPKGEATHQCIACHHSYTPEPDQNEDCPACGCDGTQGWTPNVLVTARAVGESA